MFKVLIFARRRPDLDRQTFISLYETQHMTLSDRLVADGTLPPMVDYRRNYVIKTHDANIGSPPDFDVVTEAWFENEAAFSANREGVSRPDIAQLVMDDLGSFLDLTSLTYVVVDERCGTPAMNAKK